MTAVLEPPAVQAEAPDVDPDCPKCGTYTAVMFAGSTTETVFELGEQPGPKWAWQCRTCGREWTTPASEPAACPDGLSWCVSHEADRDGGQHHASALRAARYMQDGYRKPTSALLVVGATRDVRPDGTVEPLVWVDPSSHLRAETYGFTPAAARELAMALLAAAAEASGFKRADDLRIDDRIVVDGQAQTVTVLTRDACYCDGDMRCCDGEVQIHTDVSEEIDESTPAVVLDPADLVQVAP